jgi:hypothetical protein
MTYFLLFPVAKKGPERFLPAKRIWAILLASGFHLGRALSPGFSFRVRKYNSIHESSHTGPLLLCGSEPAKN